MSLRARRAKQFLKVQVIVVAGGSGERFKSRTSKSFVLLKGKPLAAHCLSLFDRHPAVDGIVLVGAAAYLGRFARLAQAYPKVRVLVAGGKTRAQSVQCGLAAVDEDTDIVLVHDAARPLVDQAMVDGILAALRTYQAAVVAVPVKATIKRTDQAGIIMDTPRRDQLWEAQTPQGFHKKALLKAHARPFAGEATDDAVLVEAMGIKVKVVMGAYRNIKVTTPEDLRIVKGLI